MSFTNFDVFRELIRTVASTRRCIGIQLLGRPRPGLAISWSKALNRLSKFPKFSYSLTVDHYMKG